LFSCFDACTMVLMLCNFAQVKQTLKAVAHHLQILQRYVWMTSESKGSHVQFSFSLCAQFFWISPSTTHAML
jgi:hypothetical protein